MGSLTHTSQSIALRVIGGSLGALLVLASQAAGQTTTPAPDKAPAAKAVAVKTAKVPDLHGSWTNATLTRLERPAAYGARLEMTQAEAAGLEGEIAKADALGRQPTAAGATVKDLPADCSAGRGNNCNYNAAWTDSGSQVMTVNGQRRTSLITLPADGHIPFTPELKARYDAARRNAVGTSQPSADYKEPPGVNDNPEGRSLSERCLIGFGYTGGPVMLPTLYNNTYEIVQGKDAVAILVEMVHDVRIVRLNAQHRTDGVTPWLGDSIGWYEGQTLVVETTGYNPKEAFFGVSPKNLKVTERFTRKGPNRMLYQFKVENPDAFTQPWGGEYEFRTASGPVYEYACHEGNYALRNILAGARVKEKTAASAASAPPAKGE